MTMHLSPLTFASLLALIVPSRLDNLIRSHLNNSDSSGSANGFWLECDYHSIESNYFEQVNNTFALSSGSNIRYKCSLLIDATNCSIYHGPLQAAVTKLIPLNCRDVQIVIQLPGSVSSSPELSQSVHENALQVPYQAEHEKYIAWLNISNFTEGHQGQYSFLFQTSPPLQTVYKHRFTLLPANMTFHKGHALNNHQSKANVPFDHPSGWCAQTDALYCKAWLALGLLSTGLGLVCLAIYLFAFKRMHRNQTFCLPRQD